jgi:chemotaxis signal transduction protein
VHDLARFLGVDEPTLRAVIVVGDDAALVGLAVGTMRGIARSGERSPTLAPHPGVAGIVDRDGELALLLDGEAIAGVLRPATLGSPAAV